MARQAPANHAQVAHDYVAHVIDCLEEAEAALHLALRRGQMPPSEEADLGRQLEDLTRAMMRFERPHWDEDAGRGSA